MILLIDNYDSFTYNLVHYFGILGAQCDVRRNDSLSVEEALKLNPQAIVLSPGPRSPNEAGICCELIAAAGPQVPILGVCLGHQALGQVYGAQVVRTAKPMHGKVSDIFHDGTGVFQGLDSPTRATRYHSLTLAPESIPECFAVNAWTADELVMGVRHKTLPYHGVQFHPESIASEDGLKILSNFLALPPGLLGGGQHS